jgi:hypothetical protein
VPGLRAAGLHLPGDVDAAQGQGPGDEVGVHGDEQDAREAPVSWLTESDHPNAVLAREFRARLEERAKAALASRPTVAEELFAKPRTARAGGKPAFRRMAPPPGSERDRGERAQLYRHPRPDGERVPGAGANGTGASTGTPGSPSRTAGSPRPHHLAREARLAQRAAASRPGYGNAPRLGR